MGSAGAHSQRVDIDIAARNHRQAAFVEKWAVRRWFLLGHLLCARADALLHLVEHTVLCRTLIAARARADADVHAGRPQNPATGFQREENLEGATVQPSGT